MDRLVDIVEETTASSSKIDDNRVNKFFAKVPIW